MENTVLGRERTPQDKGGQQMFSFQIKKDIFCFAGSSDVTKPLPLTYNNEWPWLCSSKALVTVTNLHFIVTCHQIFTGFFHNI